MKCWMRAFQLWIWRPKSPNLQTMTLLRQIPARESTILPTTFDSRIALLNAVREGAEATAGAQAAVMEMALLLDPRIPVLHRPARKAA